MFVTYYLQELQNHPAFMKEFDVTKPMSPALEGLMALKYDTDDAIGKRFL